jgi:predicted CXXCH cytochrome family protein
MIFKLIAALLVIAGSMGAHAGTITGSAHDFSAQAWSGGRICVACHTPHKADTSITDGPLWNHAISSAAYTLYGSPTMNATISQPGGGSKLCLSINSFGGVTGATMVSTANNLGVNLKASHPIGFTYDTALATADGSLFDPSVKTTTIGSGAQTRTGTVASVLLYGGKLECDSCHDVHNTFTVGAAGSGLVKVDPAGSQICFACHNK